MRLAPSSLAIVASLTLCCATPREGAPPSRRSDSAALRQSPDALLAGQSSAIAYSGYRKGQHPDEGAGAVEPSEAEVLEDLRILSRSQGFGLIRLYGADAHAERTLALIRAHELPLKVMQGAWLRAEASNHAGCPWLSEPIPPESLAENRQANIAEVSRTIALAREYPEIIVAVNVGNEVLVSWTDHLVPVERLSEYLRTVKRSISQPVTVADNYVAWAQQGVALRHIIDFVAVHTYPAWESKQIEEALSYTVQNLERVRRTLPEKPFVIGEAGWPSIASEFGARASQAHQRAYFDQLESWARDHNVTTFFFEAFDEDWKGGPADPRGAEKHWGLFDIDRRPKRALRSRYPDLDPAPEDR